MLEIGRLAVKTCGREAGKKAIVVDIQDDNFVLIDGQVKRRRCNISHLEPLAQILKIKKNASHEEIVKEFKKLGIDLKEKKSKEKKEKPKKQRKIKEKLVKEKKEKPKEKKEAKK